MRQDTVDANMMSYRIGYGGQSDHGVITPPGSASMKETSYRRVLNSHGNPVRVRVTKLGSGVHRIHWNDRSVTDVCVANYPYSPLGRSQYVPPKEEAEASVAS